MGRLTDNTVLTRPGTVDVVALAKGDEVPSWAEGLIGDHLIEQGEEKPKRAPQRAGKGDTNES